MATTRTVPIDQIEEHLLAGGWPFEVRAGNAGQARACVRTQLAAWLAAGLPCETGSRGEVRLDPAEVVNWMVAEGCEAGGGFWRDHYTETNRRLVRELHGAGEREVPDLEKLQPRVLRFRLERRYARAEPAPRTLRARLPRPLDDSSQEVFSLRVNAPRDGVLVQLPDRIEWQAPPGWTGEATLSLEGVVRLSCGAHGSAAPLDVAARALYTRLDEAWIEHGPRTAAIASALAPAGADDGAIARSAFDAVLRCARLGALHYGHLPARGVLDHVLRHGWFDCQLAAALFCALCRRRGVPARLVSGYQLYATWPTHHYWAQAWIAGRGWTFWDLSVWHLSLAGSLPGWRTLFAGAAEHRLALQVFPHSVTGPGTFAFPRHWHMLHAIVPGGSRTRYVEAATGRLIYEESFFLLK